METANTIHYEFRDYKELIGAWKEAEILHGNELQLVVSHHEYSSGFWIERKGVEAENPRDFLYTAAQVPAYFEKLLKGIAKGKSPDTIL